MKLTILDAILGRAKQKANGENIVIFFPTFFLSNKNKNALKQINYQSQKPKTKRAAKLMI